MHNAPVLPRYTEEGEYIFTIEELNRAAANALESQFHLVFVTGEVSNLSKPASGHIYFSLKDQHAQIRCAWFRGHQSPFAFQLENGVSIIVLAEVTIYQDRGDYQLVIKKIFLSGAGLIQQQFEALKRKLMAEGLFDPAHKKALPRFPRCVGIITSKTGAALQDVLAIFKRRAPFIEMIVYPCAVQGEQAPASIIHALDQAEKHQACDALILTRGGGSNEDLWAFNDAKLVYRIFNCSIPLVSAVGHEIDLTLSDYVADQRAPTPSAAAELLSPNQEILFTSLNESKKRLASVCLRLLQQKTIQIDQITRLIKHPQQKIVEQKQLLSFKNSELNKIIHKSILAQKERVNFIKMLLQKNPLQPQLIDLRHKLNSLSTTYHTAIKNQVITEKHRFINNIEKIENLSPINILRRGYSILYTEKNKVLSDVNTVQIGEKISAHLTNGRLTCIVEKKD
jgi:exodeoxyribonuclease VII large subunit